MEAILGLDDLDREVTDDTSKGGELGNPRDPYRVLPCAATLADDEWQCLYMPRQAGPYRHTHRDGHHFVYNAAASRPVIETKS